MSEHLDVIEIRLLVKQGDRDQIARLLYLEHAVRHGGTRYRMGTGERGLGDGGIERPSLIQNDNGVEISTDLPFS